MRANPAADTSSRFVVGIDLGTTNSAVAYADTDSSTPRVEVFRVAQLVAPGEIERRDTLPSFHLESAPGQFAASSLRLPWDETETADAEVDEKLVVGVLARDQGADVPGRLIVSAKSWLSHSGVDRTADLLPWHGAAGVKKISPAEASARYLRHIRAAWNQEHPVETLEAQQVVITIPASFDEIARELTMDAARRAGLKNVVLIEEPQAAFYAWMNRSVADRAGERALAPGQNVLVCDIGGGTSDFTLIEVRALESGGGNGLRFHRSAVGDHLILGGDNLDLAIAHHIEKKLTAPLEPRAWSVLIRRCQQAKETLLGADAPERIGVSVGSSGAKLLRGARQIELTRDEVTTLLLDGFLPFVPSDAVPSRSSSGFQEFGLPFAADAAITRYLSAFLRRETSARAQLANGLIQPDAILLNGGFFASTALQNRLLEVMKSWFDPGWNPVLLDNPRLDLAVAEGAAHFALARRGTGAKVSGGLARAYYLGVAAPDGRPQALCVAPANMAEEQEVTIDTPFELLIRQPVEFPLYTSSFRTSDVAGELVPLNPAADGGEQHFTQLAPVRTALQGRAQADGGDNVQVQLHSRLSAVGALEIWCSEIGGRLRQWKLPFDVRATTVGEAGFASQASNPGISLEEEVIARCRSRIQATFTSAASGQGTDAVEALGKQLEQDCGLPRLDWPPILLRALWQELMEVERGRARTPMHEARWLNLLGFSLRPGFGFPVDDWRCAQTWRLYERRLEHPRNELCRAEWWIMWRRIAGGLTAGQQRALVSPLLAGIMRATEGSGKGAESSHETAEIWRLVGSLERLTPEVKTQLGEHFLSAIDAGCSGRCAKPGGSVDQKKAAIWALARLGARVPLHGPLNALIEPDTVRQWLSRLLKTPGKDEEFSFAVMQMARHTGDRYRDVDAATRSAVLAWMKGHAPPHHVELVEKGGELGAAERDAAFGERFPLGLRASA